MADLLEISARIVDSGVPEDPQNRITEELSELTDDIAVVESFSHVIALRTPAGMVAFDTSGVAKGTQVLAALRSWSQDPVAYVVYTHGHLDHVGGSAAFVAEAEASGHPRPVFVGHENVPVRFDRYRRTDGWNVAVNQRQFGWLPPDRDYGILGVGWDRFLPDDVVEPEVIVGEQHTLDAGGVPVELVHARGETDDHLWAWLPEAKAACVGDLFIWNFPNAGNPQKVQRYPEEWAAALRTIAARRPELLLPAHGLPLAGADRITRVLEDVAGALESLVSDVLTMMNGGESLDEIIHTVRVDEALLRLPYMRPLYDEPEFVVRNVWRRYGGWWDGDPAYLKPAPAGTLARELASLAGGADRLATRAGEVAADGDLRLACHLVELAAQAAPEDPGVHEVRAAVYEHRRKRETSLMTKGIFATAVRESREQSRKGPSRTL